VGEYQRANVMAGCNATDRAAQFVFTTEEDF